MLPWYRLAVGKPGDEWKATSVCRTGWTVARSSQRQAPHASRADDYHSDHDRGLPLADFLRFQPLRIASSASTFLAGHEEERLACKIEWWGVGMFICLEWGTDCLHVARPMPLSSQNPHRLLHHIKIRHGFSFLVLAYPGCPGKEAVKQVFIKSHSLLSLLGT